MTMHTPIAELTKPTHVPGTGAEIVATQNEKDRDGNYPAFVALAKYERNGETLYSTHMVYFNDDRGEWASGNGHYDIEEHRAQAAFQHRVGQL